VKATNENYTGDISRLERKLGYSFADRSILKTAVTHSSYIKEHDVNGHSNERLEFLGDAFFDAIIGEELYRRFPDKGEGFLSRTRATLACEKSLANAAKTLELGQYILLGNGEDRNGGRKRESILADAMEAILGAIYMDGGFDKVKAAVLDIFGQAIDDAEHGKYIIMDYKTGLQEKLQGRGITDIKYTLIREKGPDHDKTFFVQLKVNGKPVSEGTGRSKKQAEQDAARAMLEGKL